MQRRLRLLRMELKRAAAQLPSMIWKAVILTLVISVTVFCAVYFVNGGNDKEPAVNIGYSAPQEDALIQFAISYIENMESMQGWCNLVPMDTDKGLDALYNGDITAFIEFPEGMVEDIISGENRPATLYLTDTGLNESVLGEVFEELADAGISMLQMAQAQIYATADICMEQNNAGFQTVSKLNELYSEIDSNNIELVINREQLFKNYRLSLTGNEGITVYYACAFLVLYMLLIGILCSNYCKCDFMRQKILRERLGHSYISQLAAKNIVFTGTIVIMFFLTGIWKIIIGNIVPEEFFYEIGIRFALDAVVSVKTVILLIAAFCLVAAYYEFIYQIAGNTHAEVVIIGISAIIQGYLSGCFIPTALLPQIVVKIGKYIPAGFLKEAFTILFTGEMTQYIKTLTGICLWAVFFMIISAIIMKNDWESGSRYNFTVENPVVEIGGRLKTSCSFILFKRLLHQKTLWLFLIVMILVSALIDNLEQKSNTEIIAAIYDESGIIGQTFIDYNELNNNSTDVETEMISQNATRNDKLVSFVLCDSSEQVQDMVLKGKAQCGYILPDDLLSRMEYGGAERLIKVYDLGDAVLTPVINEIVFAQIYKKVSRNMYKNFIDETGLLNSEDLTGNVLSQDLLIEETHRKTDEYLDTRLTDNSTFHIDKKIIQNKNQDNKNDSDTLQKKENSGAAFLKEILAAAVVILCVAAGSIRALMDYKAHYFYRQSQIKIMLITVMQYFLIGVVTAFIVV